MSWSFVNQKHVKTRKDHKCVYCQRIIPKGSKNIIHWWGKWEDDFQSSYACNWCHEHSEYLQDDDMIADFWEGIHWMFEEKIRESEDLYESSIEYDLEGDYLVFTIDDKEIHREHLPIVKED
jgi:hypothetical protein